MFLAEHSLADAQRTSGNKNFPGYPGGSDSNDISSSAPRSISLQSRSLQRLVRAQLKHQHHQNEV
jgi:hypothetical protein